MHGNTSINPFFYGTFLGETKPGEPVTRTKKQAFQADAVGVAHQLTGSHFNRTHTFRVEWQPGPGGRIDWYAKGHRINETFVMEGDGLGNDWAHVYSIKDEVLKKTMGSQIPIEPTYLIFNTAVSSTWGFPYVVPDSCQKCFDCDDPKCACAFAKGFCKMLREDDVAMYIDAVRVYQTQNHSAHVGHNHTLGCDPPAYPTRGWIQGHEFKYMRNAPFSYDDKHPIKKVQKGGGSCQSDNHCGGHLVETNYTWLFEMGGDGDNTTTAMADDDTSSPVGHGKCVDSREFGGLFWDHQRPPQVCQCWPGYTGPHCLSQDHIDDTESAYKNLMGQNIFARIPEFQASPFMVFCLVALFVQALVVSWYVTTKRKRALEQTKAALKKFQRPVTSADRYVTGTTI